MTVNYTFASDEERERYELDSLAAHADTLADHETRIDTLEGGGGGGGMVEEMYGQGFGVGITTGTGTGTTSTADWSAGNTDGTDPPEIDGTDPTLLVVQADGYHLMQVTATTGGTLLPGEAVNVRVTVTRGGTGRLTLLPIHGTGSTDTQIDQRTVALRLEAGDVLTVDAHYSGTAGARDLLVDVGLSRIGQAIALGPIGL